MSAALRSATLRTPTGINVRMRTRGRNHASCRAINPLVRELFRTIDGTPIILKDVSRLADVNPRTLGSWRTGARLPAIDKLDAVARVFGLKLVLVPMEVRDAN